MKIITQDNCLDWHSLLKIAEVGSVGIQSVINENQKGRKFLTIYGNTFPIKDKLSEMGFKYFKGTWGKPVDAIDDVIKNKLIELGVDVSPLDLAKEEPKPEPIATEPQKDIPTDVVNGVKNELIPVADIKPPEELEDPNKAKDKAMVNKELDRMKGGVDMAMKQKGNDRVKGLLGFIDRMIERVAEMTDTVAQDKFIKSFLEFAAKFHDYSFGNQMLIWVQKPTASYVKGHKQWMELGRRVNDWKSGISIIAPMFKKMQYSPEDLAGKSDQEVKNMPQSRTFFSAVTVYDISDTEPIPNWEKMKGKPPFEVPKFRVDPNDAMEEITALVNSTKDWAKEKNIDVQEEKMSADLGGYSAGGKIRLNDTFGGINLFSTMVHECAHEVLHWVESDKGGKTRPNKVDSRQAKEIDAETTAFIVLQHYGFETKDTPRYLALWKAKGEDVKQRREYVRKAVQAIIEGIDSKMKSNIVEEAKSKMQIRVSKSEWFLMGRKAGWIK